MCANAYSILFRTRVSEKNGSSTDVTLPGTISSVTLSISRMMSTSIKSWTCLMWYNSKKLGRRLIQLFVAKFNFHSIVFLHMQLPFYASFVRSKAQCSSQGLIIQTDPTRHAWLQVYWWSGWLSNSSPLCFHSANTYLLLLQHFSEQIFFFLKAKSTNIQRDLESSSWKNSGLHSFIQCSLSIRNDDKYRLKGISMVCFDSSTMKGMIDKLDFIIV